MSLACCEA